MRWTLTQARRKRPLKQRLPVSAENSTGRVPPKALLPPKLMACKADSAEKAGDRDPTNEFVCRYKAVRPVNAEYANGIVPARQEEGRRA